MGFRIEISYREESNGFVASIVKDNSRKILLDRIYPAHKVSSLIRFAKESYKHKQYLHKEPSSFFYIEENGLFKLIKIEGVSQFFNQKLIEEAAKEFISSGAYIYPSERLYFFRSKGWQILINGEYILLGEGIKTLHRINAAMLRGMKD